MKHDLDNIDNKGIIYATPNKRLFAVTIDVFILSILLLPVFTLVDWLVFGDKNLAAILNDVFEKYGPTSDFNIISEELNKENFWLKYFISQFVNLLIILIPVLYLWDRTLGTPGKWILGCEIIDSKTLKAPTTSQNLIRFFSYLVSTIQLCLGFFNMYWDKKNRCWHDILAGTVVIDNSDKTTWIQRVKIAFSRLKHKEF